MGETSVQALKKRTKPCVSTYIGASISDEPKIKAEFSSILLTDLTL